jgi:hypothetical protein
MHQLDGVMKQRTPEEIAIANEGRSQSLKSYHANKKARAEWEALSDAESPERISALDLVSPAQAKQIRSCISDMRDGMDEEELRSKYSKCTRDLAKEIGWTVK